ncbi:MAG: hypothetical protein CVV51_04885 [Spirochaetae bacterium HGW-Spirochaetae-7]|nr:MAG: hypothetical protein CVV51_04885 [Spirochaetae bacterium HGW-Spirochaetae-7]
MAAYRDSGKSIQSPAIRKLLESVITQKREHVEALRAFDAQFTGVSPRIAIPASSDPEAVLKSLVDHESAFAKALDELSASVAAEEPRLKVKSMADAGRKFASWATDHLDLLALF